MTDLKSSFPSYPDVLAVFREEFARASLVDSGPALWPGSPGITKASPACRGA